MLPSEVLEQHLPCRHTCVFTRRGNHRRGGIKGFDIILEEPKGQGIPPRTGTCIKNADRSYVGPRQNRQKVTPYLPHVRFSGGRDICGRIGFVVSSHDSSRQRHALPDGEKGLCKAPAWSFY